MRRRIGLALALVGAGLLAACGDDEAGQAQRGNTPILQAPASGKRAEQRVEERAAEPRRDLPAGGDFDFYVLALSWSPSWCLDNDPQAKTGQCKQGMRGLLVHGLWPQNDMGYPQFCASSEPERVPEALGRQLFDIMPPALGLIGHQWRKHGSCTGLSQADYFATLRKAREKLRLPESLQPRASDRPDSAAALEEALTEANPGLTREAIALDCDKSRLEEIRICMTKDLGFRACPELDRKGCRVPRLDVPAPR
ncbi:hypothetical protein BJF93_16805 [Xaviernesmea oryzae]|uniref:Uncharacterized protein n=1 Tax=Xaviernesmea oryzae TaxID=464029 RepID=A0A1Q9ASV9_9HYPH|nr:hypothetical protein [Xaviernesmea oryzae]OLP58522.1 hypothetical protein BJF93_16805 [Xaviernesmea oryzae]SEK60468.1 ribonuclease T2 [Xaviernesmea oryzae]